MLALEGHEPAEPEQTFAAPNDEGTDRHHQMTQEVRKHDDEEIPSSLRP